MRAANLPEVRESQGLRAGVVSRLIADAVDLVVVVLIALLLLLTVSGIRGLVGSDFEFVALPQPARGILAGLLLVAYLGYGWGLEGRTPGKLVMGLRVVGGDGSDLSPARGLARAVLCVAFPPGILWSAVDRRHASLQDLVLGTAVVHSWGFEGPPSPTVARAGARGPAPGG